MLLRNQLLAAVNDLYVLALKKPIIGYGTLTTLELLNHLYATYDAISPADLITNDVCFKATYDPEQPIETLFQQIDDAVAYADAGNAPYTKAQILAVAYSTVFATGTFQDDCKIWRGKAEGDKTWTNFKSFFAAAHHDWRDSRSPAARNQFRTSNLATTTPTPATRDDATLQDKLATAEAALAKTKQKLKVANEKIKTMNYTMRRMPASSFPGFVPDLTDPNRHYCHTHGFWCVHWSKTCTNPGPNHDPKATRRDMRGGSRANE